jgi:hypothetical protein
MQKITGIILVSDCIAILFIAACTGMGPADATPVATPTPQIVYVTVFVTPAPAGTSDVTAPALRQQTEMDEEFIGYIDNHQIFEGMNALAAATPGAYSISTGYNAASKSEAVRMTDLLVKAPTPGSDTVKTYRSAMMDALSMMDGSTAGFSRYRDAMQMLIQKRNAVLSEMHSRGSATVDAKHFSGHGNDVRWYNTTETGLRTFTMLHTGDRNFAIILKDVNDKYISLLANEIGDYSGKKSETLISGEYYLDITADGDWTISIASD